MDQVHARIMHDNHHLQSTVAHQNTGETVLSRRATALLRLLKIRYQVHWKYIYIFMQCARITSLEQLLWQSKLAPFREKEGREKLKSRTMYE